jgi:hypothetical protein
MSQRRKRLGSRQRWKCASTWTGGLSPQPKTEKIVVRSQMMAGSRIIDNTIMSGPDFLCAKALSERMCVCVCGWLAVPCEGEINA